MKRAKRNRLLRDRFKLLRKVRKLEKRLAKAGVPRAADVISDSAQARRQALARNVSANNFLYERLKKVG